MNDSKRVSERRAWLNYWLPGFLSGMAAMTIIAALAGWFR